MHRNRLECRGRGYSADHRRGQNSQWGCKILGGKAPRTELVAGKDSVIMPRTEQPMGMVINDNTDNIALAINNPASEKGGKSTIKTMMINNGDNDDQQ